MTFGSVCSGIEAVSVAWDSLGFKAAWLSEIDPFPCAVLDHHYPDVPNLGDMTKIKEKIIDGSVEAPDVFVGGTPCQAFSVAGLRGGLNDPRGGLTLEFVRIANAIDEKRREDGREPSIIVWENVPGVLSSKDNAFGCFLGALAGEDCELVPSGKKWSNAGCVYGTERTVAWRILDAQYFGVAQRRRRVFVIASAGEIDPSEILFEFQGVRRDTPPSREAGESFAQVAGTLAASGGGMNRPAGNCNETDFIVPVLMDQGGSVMGVENNIVGTIRRETHGHEPIVCAYSSSSFGGFSEGFGTLRANGGDNGGGSESIIAFHPTQDPISSTDGTTHSLGCGSSSGQANIAVAKEMNVRRLTPTECERLQGFPDGYTQIQWRKKPKEECPDSNRYKALGNSMAVPVMHWIGARIKNFILKGGLSGCISTCNT
ncbi:MAG: DNA cytosine methyltransferase [Sulfurimonadaceae bacterium]